MQAGSQLCLFYSCNVIISPGKGNLFYVADTGVSFAHAVLHQILNEICGKTKTVVPV